VRKAPTIVQIAKTLGVAPSTVSRAFTDPGKLRPGTVQRVLDAAADVGYVPNSYARALITGRSGMIGLIVPDIANPFFPPIIRHAQLAAEELGLTVFVADTNGDSKREATLIERLSPQVEGFIIARVLVSATSALVQAIRHLLETGHTRIAYVGGPPESWSNTQRLDCVESVLGSHGIEGIFFQAPAGTHADGLRICTALVASGTTAVIAFDDVIAHGLMSGLRARGVRVPEDINVLGCDDTLAITTYPPLSSIALDLGTAGRTAVEVFRSISSHEEIPERRIELEGVLVLRGTTDPG
jgi:DNA-binding LacI/PurR family transcriptional regulator